MREALGRRAARLAAVQVAALLGSGVASAQQPLPPSSGNRGPFEIGVGPFAGIRAGGACTHEGDGSHCASFSAAAGLTVAPRLDLGHRGAVGAAVSLGVLPPEPETVSSQGGGVKRTAQMGRLGLEARWWSESRRAWVGTEVGLGAERRASRPYGNYPEKPDAGYSFEGLGGLALGGRIPLGERLALGLDARGLLSIPFAQPQHGRRTEWATGVWILLGATLELRP